MDYSATVRNNALDKITTDIDAGAGFGRLELATDSTFATILGTITYQKPSYSTAASGAHTLAGLPLSGTYSGTGTITHAREVDSDGNAVTAGTVTASGGGGDFIVDNVSATSGLPFNLVGASRSWPSEGIL